MRIIFVILITGLIYLTSTSCEEMFGDFLEKAPGVDVTEDTIFSSKAQVMLFLASCYEQGLHSAVSYNQYYSGSSAARNEIYNNLMNYSGMSDESKHSAPWWFSNQVNNGTLLVGVNYDYLFNQRWTAMRMLHTMIDRIDEVPDADDAFKTQVEAEVRFIRAQLNFDMFKRYGGIPLVKRRFLPDEMEAMNIRRSSVDSTVKWIIQDCDYAAANLPDSYSDAMKGRISKGAALALKSKTLLYAASPLFNSVEPYMEMSDPSNNKLICYGNYDVNRWKLAADAAKAVLDWAPSGGIHLITDQGVDKNYRYVWEKMDNAEIIFADKEANANWDYLSPMIYLAPAWYQQQSPLPTQSFIENFYEKKDGTPQTWGASGSDLNVKYSELEYRFHQTIGYNGFYWSSQRGYLAIYGTPPSPAGAHNAKCVTGYWLKKHIPDALNTATQRYPFNWTWYRLAEFYLNYAEALNEFNATPPQEAYDAVNTIRTRSGQPNLPTGLSQDEFRQRVRKERAVELAFDDHRWWDILRWKVAENYVNGPMYGLQIKYPVRSKPITDPTAFTYTRYVYETRVFQRRFYLTNFYVSEVNKGYLVQNPGW